MFLALTGYALYRRNRDRQGSGESV
jgi:hypothetical protein